MTRDSMCLQYRIMHNSKLYDKNDVTFAVIFKEDLMMHNFLNCTSPRASSLHANTLFLSATTTNTLDIICLSVSWTYRPLN